MKRLSYFVSLYIYTLLIPQNVLGQDSLSAQKISLSLDIYSKHLWRGFSNGTSISIQPGFQYNYHNFSAGIWGAYAIDGSYTELDLYASYTIGNIEVMLFDYFCPVNPVQTFNFFEFRKGRTKHTLDLNVVYSNQSKHPFSLHLATMIFGDDLNTDTGNNYYSTYIEPALNLKYNKTRIKLFAGFSPFKGYYAANISLINTGLSVSRKFQIARKFVLPVNTIIALNPSNGKLAISLGLNI